ncbi:MAG: hypothetical protein ACE5OP_04055 [Candidatus Glassbacteria bacterium]
MKRYSVVFFGSIFIVSLSLLSCQGEKKKATAEAGFAEADMRSPTPGGPLEVGTAVIRGEKYKAYIQKANSRVYSDLGISARGAFYMKICALPAQPDEKGALKFDVIAGEGTDSQHTIYGGYVVPLASLDEVEKFVNVVVDVSQFAGETLALSMRLAGEEGNTLAWTEPEFRPFPGGQKGKK